MPSSSPPRAQPWRAWLIWGIGVTAYMLSVANRTSLAAVGTDAAHRFSADASTLSMFAVLQLAVYGAMQLPVGILLDRLGSRPIITAGMVLMSRYRITRESHLENLRQLEEAAALGNATGAELE